MPEMPGTTVERGAWLRALELEERGRIPGGTRTADGDVERARRRLGRWKAQEPFAGDGIFAQRLGCADLQEEDLLALLAEPDETLAERVGPAPAWLSILQEAFSRGAAERFPLPAEAEAARQLGFLHLVQPLMDAGWTRLLADLRALAAGHPGAPFDPETAAGLLAPLLRGRLLLPVNRAMVLELHLASREERLAGETPEERFDAFTRELQDPAAALAVLSLYPVLARYAVAVVDGWVDFCRNFLTHLTEDFPALGPLFAPGAGLGRLTAVHGGMGDSHRGGRSVLTAVFDSGLKLVYKPRSLAVEAAFQDLLGWVESQGFAPGFRRLRLLERGDHGWAEFIEAASCASEGEVRRFYERQGGYLALLYVLGATDMHYENLIAAGEHPVMVDLEALFHPWGEELGQPPGAEPVGRPLQDSLMRIGLLPVRSWGDAENPGVDLSGLGGAGDQVLPKPMLKMEGAGTDRMRFVRGKVTLPGARNRPTLAGEDVSLPHYREALADGLERMLRLLLARRRDLLASDGPLDAFASAEVRIILRSTRAYALLLTESLHPFFLGDALDRDRFLDHLWVAVETRPGVAGLIPHEHRDLARGDIPMLTTRAGSRDLWTSDGERIPELLPSTGLERARDLIVRLDEAGITRQLWILRNAINALEVGTRDDRRYTLRETGRAPERSELLAAAVAMGERLEALALRDDREAYWLVPVVRGDRAEWALETAGPDLYLGLPGIAFFLAWLGEVAGEERFQRLARAAVVPLRYQLRFGDELLPTVGAFSGWGGVIWTLAHLGTLWGDPALLDEAETCVPRLLTRLEEDVALDVVGGAAGAAAALLGLHAARPRGPALEAARRCGEHLLAHARPMPRGGLGWMMEAAGGTPLAGFSHGAAGIAWSLLRLAAASGEERFRAAALEGIAYERSLYSPEERNWPDLRESSQGLPGYEAGRPYFMSAWCHGAAGIALGRADSLPLLDDAASREEIATAVETTFEQGFGKNHSLCHGDLGNLEPVLRAAEALGRPDFRERAGRIAGGALAQLREKKPVFGLPGQTEPAGLMVGLAGIGYGFLRLAEPGIPSVLTLEPPAPRHAL